MNGGNDMAQNNQFGNNTTMQNQQNQQNQRNAQWYFYNQMAVSQGKAAFQKQWGKRENVDDWQRVNKTVVAFQTDEPELTEEQQDSIAQAEAIADSLALIADSAQNDPHKREYYMAQIPFTEEQVAASNNIIAEGLYNSGVIFKDKLDNLPRSEKQFMRLIGGDYPNFEKKRGGLLSPLPIIYAQGRPTDRRFVRGTTQAGVPRERVDNAAHRPQLRGERTSRRAS